MLRGLRGGDLRGLRGDDQEGGDHLEGAAALRTGLQELPGIGPAGAQIFCREAQAVWPELVPYLDRKALQGAKRAGLPEASDRLARLVPERT
ncbi:hypothetical protein [Ruania zhangjianzhongii]|uniref:hypothetical protein n=1 Tax=Ruania zhangjianzhongii TaxID=2603206 RepID=UPI001652514C|nr:hypothetical protein [Ruania zhangjianzhongii]